MLLLKKKVRTKIKVITFPSILFSITQSVQRLGYGFSVQFSGGTVKRFFSLRHRVQIVIRPTQPLLQWVPAALSLG